MKEAAGALTAAVWAKAIAVTRDDHKAYREEIRAQMAEARVAVETAAIVERDLKGKVQASAIQSAERHRSEILALQAELGNARQLAGELKGSQQELSRALELARSDLEATRIDLVTSREKVGLAESESFALRSRVVGLEKSIKDSSKSLKGRAGGKKITPD